MRALMLALALLLAAQGAHAQTTTPFGMREVPLQRSVIKEKWDAVRKASAQEGQDHELLAFAKQFEGLAGRRLVGHVNRAVNQWVSPVEDRARWGTEDFWSTPLETLSTRKGDCEDVAILKYSILRLFLPDAHLRLVVGRDSMRKEGHMLLLAWVDGGWVVLNNGTNALAEDMQLSPQKFYPHFSLSGEGTSLLAPTPRLSINDILKARL